ncbi:MAG: ABC transporter permease [Cyclobacteriaceae bacterium]
MLSHFFLLLYRNFKRDKGSFLINIIGLSVGLACALFIYLWVYDESNVDKFHADSDQIFQVMENFDEPSGVTTNETTSGYIVDALANEIPEVQYSTAAREIFDNNLRVGDKILKSKGRYVGKDYFEIFSFPLEIGDPVSIWRNSNSIVLSESLAKALFNSTDDVLGKAVSFNNEKDFYVSGVFEDLPSASSENFDYALSFEEYSKENEWLLEWGSTPVYAYVKLKEGSNAENVNGKIKDIVKTKTGNKIQHRSVFLAPYSDRYLYGQYENGVAAGGRVEYVRLFSTIAIFIVMIACINFMNLSTAKASKRLKEVGIKKAIGAERKLLVIQYLGESLFVTLLSLVLAVILVSLLLPQFNVITAKNLTLNFDIRLILVIVGILIVTGLVAGSYPAFYLSGFNPATVLKGKLNKATGETYIRKGLVILQFSISVILIISVLVIYKQIDYVNSKNLGFDRENILVFDREGLTEEYENFKSFLEEVQRMPGVDEASAIGHGLTGKYWGVYGFEWEGKDPEDNTEFEHIAVYYDMMDLLDLKLKDGRMFSRDYGYGPEVGRVLFNETAIEHMGLENPVGKQIKFWGMDREIIGVVENFHFESLHEEIGPLMFSFWPDRADRYMVKIEPGREREVVEGIKNFYADFNPGFTLDYKFLDDQYQQQYVAEQRVADLSKYFAGLAILISCLGLFGLATFTAERRLKEIGIRKVLGCSEFGIVKLLSTDFTKMVLISVLIALPLSYLLANSWLDNFAFRIKLEWWYFILAGVMALIITWATIGYQLIKASTINPIQTIKNE